MKLLSAFATTFYLANSLSLSAEQGVDSRLSSRAKIGDTLTVECPFKYDFRGRTRNGGINVEVWGNQYASADDISGDLTASATTFWLDFEGLREETNTIIGRLSVATIRGYSCKRVTEGANIIHTFNHNQDDGYLQWQEDVPATALDFLTDATSA